MTEHPCKGMTKSQREAFERIATNQFPACKWPTLDALMQAGLIERGPDDTRRDAMGIYYIPSFFVPLPVHAQWCAWCSEHEGEEPYCPFCKTRHAGGDTCMGHWP
jgi:hypothetical protein